MKPQPSYVLPPCPCCSNRGALVRPMWYGARNSTKARGEDCFIFGGCPHADALVSRRVQEGKEAWDLTEDLWREHANRLFIERCEKWPPGTRDAFARELSAG